MLKVALYPSNHGFGHASRMAALASGLHRFGVFTYIRGNRPAMLYSLLDPRYYELSSSSLDFGVVHGKELCTDLDQTKQGLLRLMSERTRLLEAETSFLRDQQIDLVVADIPFLAIEAASYAGLPCIGISNFDWHFIYSRIFSQDRELRPVLNAIYGIYSKLAFSYRMPFSSSESVAAMPRIQKMGLLAKKKDKYNDVRALHGIPDDKLMVVSSHGGEGGIDLGHKELCRALDGYLISTGEACGSNHILIRPDADFPDYFKAADIILTKPGYSSFAEAVQYGKPIVYKRRKKYPEEEVLIGGLKRYKQAYDLGDGKPSINLWKQVLQKMSQDRKSEFSRAVPNANKHVAGQLIADYLDYRNQSSLVSVFDMGTNNLNYCLFDSRSEQVLHHHQQATGLGKGFAAKRLKKTSIARASAGYKLLKSFDDKISSSKTLIGTAICREADNVSDLRARLGDPGLKVISAYDEIKLVYHTIKPYLDTEHEYLAFDLGGGSTEFINIKHKGFKGGKSLAIGLLKLYQNFRTMPERIAEIRNQLAQISSGDKPLLLAIGLSPAFLLKLIRKSISFPEHNGLSRICRRDLVSLRDDLESGDYTELTKYMAEPANKEILQINCIFMLEVLDRFATDEILVCLDGISVGYARQYASRKLRKK